MSIRRPPPADIAERARMFLRVGAVGLAYFLYRLFADEDVLGGLAIGVGALAIAFAGIERATNRRGKPLRPIEIAGSILGLVLLAAGLVKVA